MKGKLIDTVKIFCAALALSVCFADCGRADGEDYSTTETVYDINVSAGGSVVINFGSGTTVTLPAQKDDSETKDDSVRPVMAFVTSGGEVLLDMGKTIVTTGAGQTTFSRVLLMIDVQGKAVVLLAN